MYCCDTGPYRDRSAHCYPPRNSARSDHYGLYADGVAALLPRGGFVGFESSGSEVACRRTRDRVPKRKILMSSMGARVGLLATSDATRRMNWRFGRLSRR